MRANEGREEGVSGKAPHRARETYGIFVALESECDKQWWWEISTVERKHRSVMIFGCLSDKAKFWGVVRDGWGGEGLCTDGWTATPSLASNNPGTIIQKELSAERAPAVPVLVPAAEDHSPTKTRVWY